MKPDSRKAAVIGAIVAVHLAVCAVSFSLIPIVVRPVSSAQTFSLKAFFDESGYDDYHDDNSGRQSEFTGLEPMVHPEVRRSRLERDERIRSRFVKYGNDLWDLRKEMERLSRQLVSAITTKSTKKESFIRDMLREAEAQDPELVYKLELEALSLAQREGRTEDAIKHSKRAASARSCLPQFNLEGLWVGKYGRHGYELINVTYSGDSLFAYKVTGDKNVPRGELTFQANLSPHQPRKVGKSETTEDLQPILLTEKASQKWGTTELPRYKGMGQVAEAGFTNHQWMDGQLIIIGEDYFSFAWVPIEQQIFFGRPSPELALKMLRDSGTSNVKGKIWDKPPSVDDDVSVLKDYVASCLDKTTETIDDHLEGDPFSCIWHENDSEECYFE